MAYKNKYCATQNFTDPEYAYRDRTVMLQRFCGKRQNNTLCCPPKNKTKLTDGGRQDGDDDDDDDCEIEIKGKNVYDNVTINLEELPYGGSCTYEVKAKCGYPQLVVNNTNIDMVVAFKKKEWDNDTYKPDDDDYYDDDEEWEGEKDEDGHIEYHMKEKEKHDHSDTDCQKVKMYITLTNLLSPNRPQLVESSLGELQAVSDALQGTDGDQRIAMMQYVATDQGAVDPNSGLFMGAATLFSSAILFLAVLF